MSRTTKKVNPGRILFVGAGPGDPDLLTVRARSVLCSATTAFIDPDVPPGVVELIGSVHRPEAALPPGAPGPVDPEAVDTADDVDAESSSEDPVSVHPALGAPADVAKTLVGIAKTGTDVVRVVAGDPLTSSAVLAEVGAVARTSVAFEVHPACLPPRSCPATPACRSARATRLPMCAATSIGRRWPLRPVRWSCTARPAISPRPPRH